MHTYECFYKTRRTTILALSSYAAQQSAAIYFKTRKGYEITVVLVELGSDTSSPVSVTHTPSE